jgi:hypothetical protein
MNSKKTHAYLLFTILIIATVLSGCDFTSKIKIGEVRLGMFGDNADGLMHYSYRTFTGIESDIIQAQQGQTISYSYALDVNRGSLIIEWQDPKGEVAWREIFETSVQGINEIPVVATGTHTITIQGKDTGGSFKVSWEVE